MCAADHGRARHYADGQPVCDRIRKTATSVPRDRSRITKHNSHKAETRAASLIALNSSIMVPGVRYARSRRAPRFRCQKCISRCELCFKRTVLLFTWTMRCHTGTLLRRLRSYEPALGIIWTNYFIVTYIIAQIASQFTSWKCWPRIEYQYRIWKARGTIPVSYFVHPVICWSQKPCLL